MHGGAGALVVGPSDPATLLPDLAWLARELQDRNGPPASEPASAGESSSDRPGAAAAATTTAAGTTTARAPAAAPAAFVVVKKRPLRMVTLVNPGNPSGVTLPGNLVRQAQGLCAAHGCWLVVDNTYEHFAGGWFVGLAVL
jgi:hypothetical protein